MQWDTTVLIEDENEMHKAAKLEVKERGREYCLIRFTFYSECNSKLSPFLGLRQFGYTYMHTHIGIHKIFRKNRIFIKIIWNKLNLIELDPKRHTILVVISNLFCSFLVTALAKVIQAA